VTNAKAALDLTGSTTVNMRSGVPGDARSAKVADLPPGWIVCCRLNQGRHLQTPADRTFELSIQAIQAAIDIMAGSVAPPVPVRTVNGFHYRYRESNVRQALILKSVRNYSALLALRALINAGLPLDAGAMMRVLDEVGSDILFIAGPTLFGKEPEDNHHRFLSEFFQEEFDHPNHSGEIVSRAGRYGHMSHVPFKPGSTLAMRSTSLRL
jgi:hypothetical protein